MNKLPDDLVLEIIKKIDSVEALKKFCKLNKQNVKLCQDNAEIICKSILDNLKVDYNDPRNFIFVANHIFQNKINDYKYPNGKWKYKSLFKLYMKYYYTEEINLDNWVTSFPIYPNLKVLRGLTRQLDKLPDELSGENFSPTLIPLDFKVRGKFFQTFIPNLRIEIIGFTLDIDDDLVRISDSVSGQLSVQTRPTQRELDRAFDEYPLDSNEFEEYLRNILREYRLDISGLYDFELENFTFVGFNQEFLDSWEERFEY